MRIISGDWRGRRLPRPAQGVRPTPDRAREALFSILYSRGVEFSGARWLDLFSGTGAVGLEALSRGAAICVFVDIARKHLATTEAFLKSVNASDRGPTLLAKLPHELPLLRRFAASGPFDVIFADPPYSEPLEPAAVLLDPVLAELTGPDTMVVWERESHAPDPKPTPHWRIADVRTYGRVVFYLYQPEPEQTVQIAASNPAGR